MKKLIGLLTFILIGLINFGYCENVEDLIDYAGNFTDRSVNDYYSTILKLNGEHSLKSICVKFLNFNVNSELYIGFSMSDGGTPVRFFRYANNGIYTCLDYYDDGYLVARSNITQDLDGSVFVLSDLLTTPVPKLTSLQCQTEYNLIPISSVDQNYCVNNGLCPSSGGGDCPGSGDNWSALYINDIQHLGKPIINITIPDYITWDYTTNENEFNLYCGSGYDQDYIDSIISINSYRPDSGDFTNIFVSGLTLVFPYIVIVLFIVFVRRLLKRIFR